MEPTREQWKDWAAVMAGQERKPEMAKWRQLISSFDGIWQSSPNWLSIPAESIAVADRLDCRCHQRPAISGIFGGIFG